jgi:Niemann-Pick C1 protein
MLGLSGVGIVICALIISTGLCSLFGIKATLIISEVIPFLVLAIGVDNIFILVNTFEKLQYDSEGYQMDERTRIGKALCEVGPSIALASLSESLAFLLGALTRMPAVKAFSIYASVAIFFDFLLQMTCFASIMILDSRRTRNNRVDCFPCIQLRGNDDDLVDERSVNYDSTQPLLQTKATKKERTNKGILRTIFKNYYAPVLFHPVTKGIVIILFIGMLFAGVNFSTQLSIGLDQRVALPQDSYLINYFNKLDEFLAVGPPFYLVIKSGKFLSQSSIMNVYWFFRV